MLSFGTCAHVIPGTRFFVFLGYYVAQNIYGVPLFEQKPSPVLFGVLCCRTFFPCDTADLPCDAPLSPMAERTERFDGKDSSSSSNGKRQDTSDKKKKGEGFVVQSVSLAGSNAGSKVSPAGVDYAPAMLAVTLTTVRRRFGKGTARSRRSRNSSNRRSEVRHTRSRVRVGKARIAAGIG